MGGGSVYAKDAVFVGARRRPQRAGDNCRRIVLAVCILHLGRDTGALDQLGQMTADLAARFSARSARKFIPEQSENLHLSRSAANSDIPIKQLSPNTLGQIDSLLRARTAPAPEALTTRHNRGLVSSIRQLTRIEHADGGCPANC
jgi:hypothetical protein